MVCLRSLEPALRIVEIISLALTAIVTMVIGWVAYKKYLREEHIRAHYDRIEVFSTKKQTTELRATEEGLQLYLHDIRQGRGGIQWTLPPSRVQHVLDSDDVNVDPKESTFSIGHHQNWRYSKSLYPNYEKLQEDITDLLKRVIELDGYDYGE